MSLLRDVVTGSDTCTTSDDAGPSNAAGFLANTLLGGSSKAQEHLREVCDADMKTTYMFRRPDLNLNYLLQVPHIQPGGVHGAFIAPTAASAAAAAHAMSFEVPFMGTSSTLVMVETVKSCSLHFFNDLPTSPAFQWNMTVCISKS
jgi:hypothetical protein